MSDDKHLDIGSGDAQDRLERAEALAAVMRAEREKAERTRSGGGGGGRRKGQAPLGVKYAALVVSALTLVYVWFLAPPWLVGEVVQEVPVVQEEANLRMAMYIQVQRLRAFEQREGRLPENLEEAGPPLPNVEYVLNGDNFILQGVTDRLTLTYNSRDPIQEFVGEAEDRVDLLQPAGGSNDG